MKEFASALVAKCHKRYFSSRRDAKRFMKIYNKSHKDVVLTDVYQCSYCFGYHMTSIPKDISRNFKIK